MKKAVLIPLEKKKDAQVRQDIELGPGGRFLKMFDLISLSIMFSPKRKLEKEKRPNFVELKRIA